MADATLNPEDFNWFRTQRRNVDQTYRIGATNNQYAQDVATNQYGRDQGTLADTYKQKWQQLPGSYAARGLLDSGIYQKAQTDLATQQGNAYANLQGGYQDQLGGLKVGLDNLELAHTGGQNDVQDAETARRAALAAQLRAAGVGY